MMEYKIWCNSRELRHETVRKLNFSELRKAEIQLRRIPLLGTSVNKVNIRPRRGRAAASPHIPPAPVRVVVANSLSFSLCVSACY
jgi:hypothetical protein